MYKKSFTKIISLMLIISMLCSGCSKGAVENDAAATPASTTENEASTDATEQTPVTITILTNGCGHEEGSDITDPVIEELAKRTGVTVKTELISSQDDLKSKIAAMAASGDLPDVVWLNPADSVSAKQQIQMLINADAVYDMTELMDTNGQNFLNNDTLNYAVQYVKKFYGGEEEKLYAIPTYVGAQSKMNNPSVGAYIRWDYYKELGYPEVKDENDLLDVLEQIQNNHPTAPNGKKAYAFSFFTDWGLEAPGELTMVDGWAQNQLIAANIETEEASAYYTDPDSDYWKWIKWMNQARQRGLLDPDSFTMKYDQWQQKVKNGETYFFTEGWCAADYVGEEGEGYAPLDYQPDQPTYANFGVACGACLWVVTKNCKYPDRVMDFFNYCSSAEGQRLIESGVEGQAWDLVDGVPTLRQEVVDAYKESKEKADLTYGIEVYNQFAGLTKCEIDPTYNTTYDIRESAEYIMTNQSAVQKDCAEHYGARTTGDIFTKRMSTYLNPIGSAMPAPSGDMKVTYDLITAYLNANWLKPILAENDAEYEASKAEMIQGLLDIGAQEVTDWQLGQWEEIKAIVDTIQ